MLGLFTSVVVCLVVFPLVASVRRWGDRAPVVGIALWLAVGVVGWLSLLALFICMAGGQASTVQGSLSWLASSFHRGHPLQGMTIRSAVGLTLAIDLVVLMVGALTLGLVRLRRARSRQRSVVDLVAQVDPRLGVHVVDHEQPVAYFVPGAGGRIVLSTGTFDHLGEEAARAVVAHEMGHRGGWHGAVLAPLEAWAPFVTFVPYARCVSSELRGYLEMAADDSARRTVGVAAIRAALAKASVFAPSPRMALGLSSDLIERRMARLEKGVTSKALNRCAVVAVTTIATLGLCALGVL